MNITPVKCPFTGTLIYDGKLYYEPFARTLICYALDVDMDYNVEEFNIVEEIVSITNSIYDYIETKRGQNLLKKELCCKFTWLKNGFLSNHDIVMHPLVKRVYDDNDYNSMNSSIGVLYFARLSDQQIILNDFKALLNYLKLKDFEY